MHAAILLFLTALSCFCDDRSCLPLVPGGGSSLLQRNHGVSAVSKRWKSPELHHDTESAALTQGSENLPELSWTSGKEIASNSDDDAESISFPRLAARMATEHAEPQGLLRVFCTRHPCSLLPTEEEERHGLGETAPLTEDGYKHVANLKNDDEMKSFILRAIQDVDCHVADEGGLMGMVPWFSGTTAVQSFAQLEDALLLAVLADGKPWIFYKNSAGTDGDNASLDLQGYVEVACVRQEEEMKKFVRRLCQKAGVQITDESGFEGMVKYYSRATIFKSFKSPIERLLSEIEAAATAPNSWASFKSTA